MERTRRSRRVGPKSCLGVRIVVATSTPSRWIPQRLLDDELVVGLAAQAVAVVLMRQYPGGTSRPTEGIGPSRRQDWATMVIGCSTGADTGPSTR